MDPGAGSESSLTVNEQGQLSSSSSFPGIRELQPAPGSGILTEHTALWTEGLHPEVSSPLSPSHTQSFGSCGSTSPSPSSVSILYLQVIVMSGHETIRVLEVGVDAQLPAEEESKGLEGVAAEGSQSGDPAEVSQAAGEAGPDNLGTSAEATGTRPSLPPGTAPSESQVPPVVPGEPA
ncbi:hypothetical protein P7K49_019833 [Saguinus oedipus]|uniref:Uncharacterized protein n=1 Tax=Saguinus oedipus TaxID=9490 RepID=A0ABQ9UYU6_SAGOE|nr:hypothetical protein P7K49_019833 [Saguinus oedipus]